MLLVLYVVRSFVSSFFLYVCISVGMYAVRSLVVSFVSSFVRYVLVRPSVVLFFICFCLSLGVSLFR